MRAEMQQRLNEVRAFLLGDRSGKFAVLPGERATLQTGTTLGLPA